MQMVREMSPITFPPLNKEAWAWGIQYSGDGLEEISQCVYVW